MQPACNQPFSSASVPAALADMAEQKLIQQDALSRVSCFLYVHSQADISGMTAGLLP